MYDVYFHIFQSVLKESGSLKQVSLKISKTLIIAVAG